MGIFTRRAKLAALLEEQEALRRVATLVATRPSERVLLEAVTTEVGLLLDARTANLVRYGAGDTVTVMGGWSAPGARSVPPGSVLPLDDDTAIVKVRRTERPARLDGYEGLSGALAETLRSVGIRSSVAAPVVVDGRVWGAVTASTTSDDLFPTGAEHRLGRFAELVAQAIANAEANDELRASRARLVEAAHDERRRIERNLHDGAQQRLVSLSLTLRLAQGKLQSDPDAAAELLAGATGELAQALEELRELARGIHPAILSDRGLSAALQALAMRAPLPVELVELPDERLPEAVEAAAYYVVSEGLTNVAKYALASTATVRVARRNGSALVEIADDGIGGADPARGSGLRGLADRVEALDGRIEVTSEPGAGTTILAAIPCGAA